MCWYADVTEDNMCYAGISLKLHKVYVVTIRTSISVL